MAQDLVTAAQAGPRIGRSPGFFASRKQRGASLPEPVANVGRQTFYEMEDVEAWWEEAQYEPISRARTSNLPEGVRSRASVMLLDDEFDALKVARGDSTVVDFVRELILKGLGIAE